MNILTTQNSTVHAVAIDARSAADEAARPAAPGAVISTAGSADKLSSNRNVVRVARRWSRGLRQVAGGAMLASLMACGSMPGERAASGAGIGAGAGAAIGAVTGMGVGTGAAIGAAAGAATGGLTKEDDVNLGKPVWK